MPQFSRRDAIALGALILRISVCDLIAAPDEAAAEVAKFTGGKTPRSGSITIELPEIAENGNAVPLAIAVNNPMTLGDHVSEVLVLADRNPRPVVAKFNFSPLAGRAQAATRIRVASSQTIIVVARTSSGALFMDSRPIKVTIGGCGG
jgi:sulfur-oxidizing protein SoxY